MNKPAILASNPRHTHAVTVKVNGEPTTRLEAISCPDAENELQELRLLKGENKQLKAENANYARLISGSMQIVFRMGPALQLLLSESLNHPELTDDQSAVKLEGLLFTVVIDPFGEKIIVRDVAGVVPEMVCKVHDGRLDKDSQTLLLGHVQRIKAASNGGADPVADSIELVARAG